MSSFEWFVLAGLIFILMGIGSAVGVLKNVNRHLSNISVRLLDIEKELKLRLTDGFDVYWKLQEEARPIAINITVLLLVLLWAGFRIVRC